MKPKMRIGYACINTQLPSPNRTCRLSNATPEKILSLARENLERLEKVLQWNAENDVTLFRISSDTIPFGSHEVNTVAWWKELKPELDRISKLIHGHKMRVSMHPGQFTVLNSTREKVVEASIAELEYHARLLDTLNVDHRHKIIVHLGGVFGDKTASMNRFIKNFARLSASALGRVIIENDEKSYTLADALVVSKELSIPVVFDVFHHSWNPSLDGTSLVQLIKRAMKTWGKKDGRPKLHYSNQWPGKPAGSHSQSVDLSAFKKFYTTVRTLAIDIMFETKDKEQSVLKIYREIPSLVSQTSGHSRLERAALL